MMENKAVHLPFDIETAGLGTFHVIDEHLKRSSLKYMYELGLPHIPMHELFPIGQNVVNAHDLINRNNKSLPEVIAHPRSVGPTVTMFDKLHRYQQALITGYIDMSVMNTYYKYIISDIKERKSLVEKYGITFNIEFKFKYIVDKLVNKFIEAFELSIKMNLRNMGHFDVFSQRGWNIHHKQFEYKSYKKLKEVGSKYF